MTERKSAGYFDSVRNCPIYEGDVFYDKGLINPFFRVVLSEEKGFVVHHVGSTETYKLSDEGALLIKRQYIGNEIENSNLIKEFEESLSASEQTAEEPTMFANTPISDATETISEEAEIVEETPQTEPIEATETIKTESEEVSETTPEAIEEKIATVEQANEELKESNEKLKENIATMSEPEEKEEEREQICSTDTDVTTTENAENPAELLDNGTGTDTSTVSEEPAEKTDDKPTEEVTGKNVIVEVAREAVPEIIANTKDEKNALLRKRFITTQIDRNNAEILKLREKVEYHTELASTLVFEPFVKLKNLVCEDLHTKVDDENIKGIKERTKDFESIVNIQNLLKDHKDLANKADNQICDLENENSKFEDELAELEQKIDTFARQNKLPLGVEN